MNDWSDEKTDDPLYADDRNFYKGGGVGSSHGAAGTLITPAS